MKNAYDFNFEEELDELEEFNGLEKNSKRGLRRKRSIKKAIRSRNIAEKITGCFSTRVEGHGKELIPSKKPLYKKALNEYSKNKAYKSCKRVKKSIKNADLRRIMSAENKIYEFGISCC